MQSRRDLVQAYQFSVARLVRAVATGDDSAGEPPMRRAALGMTIGGVAAALLCGGAFLMSVISPKESSQWHNPGSLIVEKDTGNRYVMEGDQLRPVANRASALLIVGVARPVHLVSASALKGIGVGPQIGIPGAPDVVPRAADLLPGAWAVCAGPNGKTLVDFGPPARDAPGPGGQRVLVEGAKDADGASRGEFVVWDSVKYPVPNQAALVALGLGDRQPIAVSSAWLAALTTGPDITAAPIAGAGSQGPPVAGVPAKVGTLFKVPGGPAPAVPDQYYVLLGAGLAPVTATEAALARAGGAAAPVIVGANDVAAAEASSDRTLLNRIPDFLSGPVYDGGSTLCAVQTMPGVPAATRIVTLPAAAAALPAVAVPAGRGMLVAPPGQVRDTALKIYLVVGGVKYPLSPQAMSALGYATSLVRIVPDPVLSLIPSGPVLDPEAAQKDVRWP